MKRNVILLFATLAGLIIVVNSTKRILSFRTNAREVVEAQAKLDRLKTENERLKADFEYKKGEEFAEGEIRNKLGLAKPNEAIVVLPREGESSRESLESSEDKNLPNWKKWWSLFFEG